MHAHAKILPQLIERFAPNGIGVEIGIQRGSTSLRILKNTSTKHLYMIDPWVRNYAKNEKVYTSQGNPDKDAKYVTRYFDEHFPDKSTIIRKKAENAMHDVPDDLDFIFIDGNHQYQHVMRDLNFWVPKIKSNGLVAGHDWHRNFVGVIEAVTNFCHANEVFLPPTHKVKGHVPAPSNSPVVMKSWPHGHVWWAIKK